MCGRFAFISPEEDIEELVPGVAINYWPGIRYNVAPGQEILAIIANGSAGTFAARWGLVPYWAKDPAIGNRMINARRETVAEKPSYRKPFRRQRCIIPASGFYEWKREGAGKIPFFFRLSSGKPMAFAGLYDRWRGPGGGELLTGTIITAPARGAVAEVHDRMPVILGGSNIIRWLDNGEGEPGDLKKILDANEADGIESHRVSTLVNSPHHDERACIEPEK